MSDDTLPSLGQLTVAFPDGTSKVFKGTDPSELRAQAKAYWDSRQPGMLAAVKHPSAAKAAASSASRAVSTAAPVPESTAPTRDQIDRFKQDWLSNIFDPRVPNQAAKALALNAQDPAWNARLKKMQPVSRAAILEQADVIRQNMQRSESESRERASDTPFGGGTALQAHGFLQNALLGYEGANKFHENVAAGQAGKLPIGEGITTGAIEMGTGLLDPEGLAMLFGGGGIAKSGGKLTERAVLGAFSGMMGQGAYEDLRHGNIGGAIFKLGMAGTALGGHVLGERAAAKTSKAKVAASSSPEPITPKAETPSPEPKVSETPAPVETSETPVTKKIKTWDTKALPRVERTGPKKSAPKGEEVAAQNPSEEAPKAVESQAPAPVAKVETPAGNVDTGRAVPDDGKTNAIAPDRMYNLLHEAHRAVSDQKGIDSDTNISIRLMDMYRWMKAKGKIPKGYARTDFERDIHAVDMSGDIRNSFHSSTASREETARTQFIKVTDPQGREYEYHSWNPSGREPESAPIVDTPQPSANVSRETKPPRFSALESEKTWGSENRGVTRAEYEKSLAALKESLGKLSSGVDPAHLVHLAKMGAFHIEAGARAFPAWAVRMKEDIGTRFSDEDLKGVYDHITKGPQPHEPTSGVEVDTGHYTGAANRITEAERAERSQGLSPVQKQHYATIGDAYLMGKAAVESGVDSHALAESIARKPRVISAEEVGTLAYGRSQLHQRYAALGPEMDAAIKAGDKARINTLREEILDTEAKFNANETALQRAGREQSAAFNARKIIIRDDGNLLDVLSSARRRAGRELTETEVAERTKLVEAHAQAQAEIERLTAENAKMAAERATQKIAEIANQQKRVGRLKGLAEERKAIIQALKDHLKPKYLSSGPGLAVDVSITLGKLAVNYIKEGVFRLDDVVAKIREDFPEFTERDVHDALSGYGRPGPKPASSLAKKIAELKREAKRISQVEDEPGKDTRVPKKPDETTNPHIESLESELSEYRKQRTRREQIAELEARLASGGIEKAPTAKSLPKSADEIRLAELKAQYNEAASNLARVEELQNRIEFEKRGVDTRTKPGEPRVQSSREQSLKAELDEYHVQRTIKEKIDALRDKLASGKVERRPVTKNLPRTEDAETLAELEKEYRQRQAHLDKIDELRNKIDRERRGEDTSATPKPRRAVTDEEKQLRDELAELRKPREEEQRNRVLSQQLEMEQAGIDTRSPAGPSGEQGPEEAELREKIGNERKLKDIHAEIADMEEQLRTGKFKEPQAREPAKISDPRLRAALSRKKFLSAQIESSLRALEPKTFLNRFVDMGRAMKLASFSVFAKLGAASAWAMPVESIANALSVPFGKLTINGRSLSSIAEREGQFSFKTEVEGYKKFFSKDAVATAKDNFVKGMDAISAEAGAPVHGNELSSLPGKLHGTVKAFLKTAEYHKAFEYRMNRAAEQAKAARETFDPSDPETITRIGYGAAVDAQSVILQGDNQLSSFLTEMFASAERNAKGIPPAELVAAVGKSMVPITKVPANYVGKTIRMTGAGLIEGAYRHAKASIEAKKTGELPTPAEADDILRAYKYGGLGMVAMTIGLTQPAWFKSAGFYPIRGGTNTNKSSKRKAMNPSEFEVAGVRVSHLIAHNPFLEAIQFWATVRRGFEQRKAVAGIGESVKGLADQAPGIESLANLGQAATGQGFDIPGFAGEYTRGMVEPQVFNELAKWQDVGSTGLPKSRKSTGFVGKIQAGVPDFRQPKKFSRKGLPLRSNSGDSSKVKGGG